VFVLVCFFNRTFKGDLVKLVRYGKPGKEKPGMIDADGKLRDLSGKIKDIGPAELSPAGLAKLAKIKPASLPLVRGRPRMGVPVNGVGTFLAIGLNYSDHADEAGMPIPKEPIMFMKAITSLCGPNDDVMLPKDSVKSDWEVELGVVIGTKAQYVSKRNALKHVAGYCVVNDVSEREYQLERGGTWDKGKGCDTFGPVGPWLVTADEITKPQRLGMWLDVNGKRYQTGTTKTMVFDVATIISYASQFLTLMPGDIITTGTPPGVGMGVKPKPVFLKAGDVMTLGIDGLGEQRQEVTAYKK
jgi:2-keto-4-pentenoate hydratase/2-oxohepta-3-ene-1,7-dioic acid hydratase in catechol pathway